MKSAIDPIGGWSIWRRIKAHAYALAKQHGRLLRLLRLVERVRP